MIHIENIPHVLQYGITHKNSPSANLNFVPIGDISLINRRNTHVLNNGTILGDYIPFYFWTKSPMLYVIQRGYNGVNKTNPENIIYCVTSKPSEYSYIEMGLKDLVEIINKHKIKSIAIPPLGAGNGGLDWNIVKDLLLKHLEGLDCEIYVYEPNNLIKEALRKERVPLTPARAMLLSVLFELVKNGEFISEFSAEKVAYFLQRFGAKDVFQLEFKKNFYGPYSGKVKHVLYYLNGSYITGYSSKDRKPFENLELIFEAEVDVNEYLNQPENSKYLSIVEKTKAFLNGFYSNFGLELLSTVDFIKETENLSETSSVINKIENWSDRKRTLFASNPKFIDIALKNLNTI